MVRRFPAVLLLGFLLGFPPAPAAGQGKVRVVSSGIQPSTVKLGNSARIVITVKGVQKARLLPLPKVEGLEIRSGPPSERTFISFDGFRQVREVSLSFVISITPTRKGTFKIPPIKVKAGGAVWATEEETLEVVEDFLGRQYGYLEVKASLRRVYVHQPFRVEALFGVEEGIVENVQGGLSLRLPWWENLPGTVTLEGKDEGGGARKQRVLVNGKIEEAAPLGVRTIRGRRFLLFRLARRFLPTESGDLVLGAGFLHFKMAVSFTTDFFGQRVPREVETCTVPGKAMTVKVLPLPSEGQPAGFSGAVGVFRVQAEAFPRKVRVGDSVKVTLTIQGEGNLGFFRVPGLEDLKGFRCYGKTEEKEPGAIRVVYDLVPVKPDVKAVPSIPFDYFDTTPGKEGYKRVETRPIPLEVLPLPPGRHLAPLPGTKPALRPGVDDIVDIKVFDPSRPMARPDEAGGAGVLAWIFGPPLAWLLFLLAWRARARALADPAALRRKRAYASLRKAFRDPLEPEEAGRVFERFLGDLWGVEPAAVQGGGWREFVADRNLPGPVREGLERVEEELDRVRFAPRGEADPQALREEILSLARELADLEQRRVEP